MEVMTEILDIFQSLWTKVLDIIGRDTFTLWVTVPFVLTTGLYWIVGGMYLLIDITKKPEFLQRYKIQPGTNEPMDSKKLTRLIKIVLINQFCVNLPMGILNWRVMRDRMRPEEVEVFPSPGRILMDAVICLLIQETGLYYTHRLFHHPVLYKHIHKIHHEWKSPIAITSMHCHPIEHMISNMTPHFLGLIVMGSHPATAWMWFSGGVLTILILHSDYHFPFLPSPEAHDYHHLKFNTCFSPFGLLDWLHGTDKMFRESRESDRHKIFLTIKSPREHFPDISMKRL